MNLLRLSIHQTNAFIGMETHNAKQEIHSQSGDLNIQSEAATLEIHSPQGELSIDSSDAWSALAKGPHFQWLNMIYSQMDHIVQQAIAKIVEDGNRMAQITDHSNAFAELAEANWREGNPIEPVSTPDYDNVKIQYRMNSPEIQWTSHQPNIEYVPHKPEVQYTPGAVDVYIRQKNSIDIRVSEYDWYK